MACAQEDGPVIWEALSVQHGRPSEVGPSEGYKDDLNLYAYVGNDPFDRVDPTGQFVQFVPVLTAAVIGAVGGAAVEAISQYKATGSVSFNASMTSAAGKGALAGMGALLGGTDLAALATSAGASATAVTAASVAGSAYGGGLATLARSQAVDIATGQQPGSYTDVAQEAVGAAAGAGAVVERAVGAAAAGAAGRVPGAVANAIGKVGNVAGKVGGEAADNAASSATDEATGRSAQPTCTDRSQCK